LIAPAFGWVWEEHAWRGVLYEIKRARTSTVKMNQPGAGTPALGATSSSHRFAVDALFILGLLK